jgi:hypothetical protein
MDSQVQGDMKKIIREMGDEIDYDWKENPRPPGRHQVPAPAESQKSLFFFAGSCVVLLAAAALVFLTFRNPFPTKSSEDPSKATSQLEARADPLEKGVQAEIGQLVERIKSLEISLDEVRQAERKGEQRFEQLLARMEDLEKKAAQRIQEGQAAPPLQTQKITTAREERVYVVQTGDTLTKIARQNGIALDELCQLNGLSMRAVIHPGQRLVVARGRPQ